MTNEKTQQKYRTFDELAQAHAQLQELVNNWTLELQRAREDISGLREDLNNAYFMLGQLVQIPTESTDDQPDS